METDIASLEREEARPRERSVVARLNGTLTQALGDVAQSGPTDQLRGYANEAIGRTKVAFGLALQSPELAMAGLAQGALGAMQRYVGEAKMNAEADAHLQPAPARPDAATPPPKS